MKVYIFILLLLIILLQSCGWENNSKQSTRQSSESFDSVQEHLIVETRDTLFDHATAIQMIEEFYRAYLLEMMKDDFTPLSKSRLENIKKQYVSESLINKIKNGNPEYNPFINAQDYADNWIETLKVSKSDLEPKCYVVSFVNDYDESVKKIFLAVKKENNTYKIDEFLKESILDPPLANIEINEDGESIINYGRYTCENAHIVIDIENSDSYKIFEKGKLLDSGKYTIDHEENYLYVNMNKFQAIYYNGALDIQNIGNTMNYFHHFESSEQKYLHFINNEID